MIVVSDTTLLQKAAGLDKGESEAIVYMDENNADMILMDEDKGLFAGTQDGS